MFRPVALTSVVMKCFEKYMEVNSELDPFQFAYRQGRSTDDAIHSITHLTLILALLLIHCSLICFYRK